MDQLEADVSALVEAAAEAGATAADTFARIHHLAAQVAGIDLPAEKPRLRLSAPPPHLTEPWFCCAQPTRRQLRAV